MGALGRVEGRVSSSDEFNLLGKSGVKRGGVGPTGECELGTATRQP